MPATPACAATCTTANCWYCEYPISAHPVTAFAPRTRSRTAHETGAQTRRTQWFRAHAVSAAKIASWRLGKSGVGEEGKWSGGMRRVDIPPPTLPYPDRVPQGRTRSFGAKEAFPRLVHSLRISILPAVAIVSALTDAQVTLCDSALAATISMGVPLVARPDEPPRAVLCHRRRRVRGLETRNVSISAIAKCGQRLGPVQERAISAVARPLDCACGKPGGTWGHLASRTQRRTAYLGRDAARLVRAGIKTP